MGDFGIRLSIGRYHHQRRGFNVMRKDLDSIQGGGQAQPSPVHCAHFTKHCAPCTVHWPLCTGSAASGPHLARPDDRSILAPLSRGVRRGPHWLQGQSASGAVCQVRVNVKPAPVLPRHKEELDSALVKD